MTFLTDFLTLSKGDQSPECLFVFSKKNFQCKMGSIYLNKRKSTFKIFYNVCEIAGRQLFE